MGLVNYKRKRGFTLVELVLVMGIIGLLFVLGIYGIGLLQKKSRDQARVGTVNNIKAEIARFQGLTGRAPAVNQMSWGTNSVIVGAGTQYARTVAFRGVAKYKALYSSATSTTCTDTTATVYYYEVTNDGYVLGVDKEEGSFDVGTSKTTFKQKLQNDNSPCIN